MGGAGTESDTFRAGQMVRAEGSMGFTVIQRFSILLVLVLGFAFSVFVYRPPRMCDPCSSLPSARTYVRVPDGAVHVWIYHNWRGRFCVAWATTERASWFLGRTGDDAEVPELVREAAEAFPDLPVVIRADGAAPFRRIQRVLDSLRRAGSREIFFEIDPRLE